MSFPALQSILGAQNVPVAVKSAVESHKETLEILTGQRGDGSERAILKGHISISEVPDLRTKRTAAIPTGLTIDGVSVASAPQVAQLIADFDVLCREIKQYRDIINALVTQLKA